MNLHSTTRDLTLKQTPSGGGTPGATFRCAACDKPRLILGRRLKRVRGVRSWVCGGCAK